MNRSAYSDFPPRFFPYAFYGLIEKLPNKLICDTQQDNKYISGYEKEQ